MGYFCDQIECVCDQCGQSVMMDATEYAGTPPTFGIDDSTLHTEGWAINEGELLCHQCSENSGN